MESHDDAIRLRLFPYSLRGSAREWLNNCDPDSFDTWDKLSTAFLQKYFPPGKTAKFRNDITGFVQHADESLYEAWERYKELQRQCPHHGIPYCVLILTFYNSLKPELQMSLNAASLEGAKIDDLSQQVAQLKLSNGSSSSSPICQLCGVNGHDSSGCGNASMLEQVNALNGKQQWDPYSNTYNPGWAHNPKLSYGNTKNI
ncbi:uncharacterized protein LOC141646307 [Silene latifolia]|uniref:uncharacterized protein LOC141646307 n=1 Tax=Silene latifolia TaxID=37657 RepID=UPI003D7833A9